MTECLNLAALIGNGPDEQVAVIDGSLHLTYADLRNRVARTASGLRNAGLSTGDQVCILAGNEPAFVVGLLAVWHAGLSATLINHQEPVPQLTHYLSMIEPHAILAGTSRQSIDAAIALGDEGFGGHLIAVPAGEVAELPVCDGDPIDMVEVTADTPALFIFTSGVSGLPRPATLTHGNLSATQAAVAACDEIVLNAGSVSLGALPMVHILGLNVAVLATLRNGGTTVLQTHWNAEQALELISEHAIDTMVLVPTMWSDLAEAPGATPAVLANVKLARCGAATLTPQIATRVHEKLGIELAQGYGLTETGGTVTFESNARARPGSVGTALGHAQIRIIDDDGQVDAEPGDPGEIWIKGDCVFSGYYGADELNDEVFAEDGWYKSGDIGVFDDRLYLVGRQKDMISVSGFKISPVEVELCLESHDAVSGSLVVGEADDRTGERVVAYVVPADGADIDEAALQDHIREFLARYKIPKSIYVVEDLPANVIGKRIRRGLTPKIL